MIRICQGTVKGATGCAPRLLFRRGFTNKIPSQKPSETSFSDTIDLQHITENTINSSLLSDEDVKKFVPYVGKGSRYSRRVVSYYVKRLDGNPRRLKRADMDYQTEISEDKIKNKQLAEKIYNENLFNVHAGYTYKILNILKETTSVEDLGREAQEKTKAPKKRRLPPHYYSEIPPIPTHLTPETFENYIHDITHSNFYYKKSSRHHGIISNLLLELLRYDNKLTYDLKQNINVFNDAIFFYAKKFDIATMKELYYQIFKLQLLPNAKTINLFISILHRQKAVPHKLPMIQRLYEYVQQFKHFDLRPDLKTYALIYNSLPEMTSKILLLEFMDKNSVPITSSLLKYVVSDMLNSMSSEKVIEVFEANNKQFKISDMDTACLNRILDKALEEKKYENAWNTLIKYKEQLKPNVETLNTFLKHFGNAERMDMAFAALNTMKKLLKVRPNIESYHLLIRCAVKVGYHKYWREVLRILYYENVRLTGSHLNDISSYWLARGKARSLADKFNGKMLKFKEPLTEVEKDFAQDIKSNIVWKDLKIVTHPTKTENEQYKATCLKLQHFGSHEHPEVGFKSKARQRYLRHIKHQSIMNIYKDRVETILHNPQISLYKKLERREVVKDSKPFLESE